jgi:hypothetical protein
MNERIRELYLQVANEQCHGTEWAIGGLENANRFAELIVRECMSINTQRLFSDYEGDSHRVAHNNALWCAWGDMKEHFGVDE